MTRQVALHDRVEVGGCVGRVTAINIDFVTIQGTYWYVGPTQGEDWIFFYRTGEFNRKAIYDESYHEWDASKLEPVDDI